MISIPIGTLTSTTARAGSPMTAVYEMVEQFKASLAEYSELYRVVSARGVVHHYKLEKP